MTLKDLAIFKHFIADKDLRKPFCRVYRASHNWAKLPGNVEEYFSNVEPMAVILSGMRICQPNSAFGYGFWQELHQDWKEYYNKVIASNFIQNDEGRLAKLEGYYKILRENWDDKDKPWRYDSYEDACIRLGLEPVVEEKKEDEPPLINFSATEGQDDGLEIDFIDFDSPRRTLYTLHKGVISVNTRSGSGRITFNRSDTKELQKKNFKYARVGKLKDGSVVMMLNNQKGINLVTNAEGYYNINSKQFVETTLGLLGINKEGVLVYLRIETISDKPDSVTIKLIKQ